MKGSIRLIVGLLVTLGAAGALDVPAGAAAPNLLALIVVAFLGLATMYSGANAMMDAQ